MRNELTRKILEETPQEIREKVRKCTDSLDFIENIIDEAYKLYMPQIRSEIVELSKYLYFKWEGERNFSPNVLEIGTKFGGTFYIWNRLIQKRWEDVQNLKNYGMAISVDMSDGGQHGGISEEEMDKRDHWFYERFENCHFIRGNSHDYATKYFVYDYLTRGIQKENNGLIWSGRYNNPFLDLLFIDGDHTYEGVKQDFEMYSPFVKPGGLVAFHDIVISDHHHSRNVYVGEFWQELKDSGKYETLEFVEPGNDWGGIGVIKMK